MHRRELLRGLAGAAILGTGGTVIAPPGAARAASGASSGTPSLGATAAACGFVYGCSFDLATLDDQPYGRLTREQARILTTDYSMKFAPLRETGPTADFSAADRLVSFAEVARIPVRGHTLIWNDGNPRWLEALSADRRAYWLDRHIEEVMGRYRGRMHSWDVVNEPFWPPHGNRGGFRGGPWYDALGPAYVTRAYARAAAVDPDVKLVLNEAFTETGTPFALTVREGLLRLVDEIKGKGLRLDAVGLQAHIRPGQPFDPDGWRRFLGDLAARGVEIWLTELDVDDRIFPGTDAERDAAVARAYRAVLDVALDEPKVTTVITWQLSDRFSFYVEDYGPTARPLPFDRDLKPKPAFDAMLAAFRAHRRV